jgi:hypothetical protein
MRLDADTATIYYGEPRSSVGLLLTVTRGDKPLGAASLHVSLRRAERLCPLVLLVDRVGHRVAVRSETDPKTWPACLLTGQVSAVLRILSGAPTDPPGSYLVRGCAW